MAARRYRLNHDHCYSGGMKVVVVYNPKSDSALQKDALHDFFKKAAITVEKFIDVTDDFEQSIQPYINHKEIVVVGYGGDGTLNSVARQLKNTQTLFAPLPGGTLNHFTKDLGVPQDLAEAIDSLKDAEPHSIDIAEVNDVVFINNSSIGIYPSSLAERSKMESRLGKWPAAVVAIIAALVKFRVYTVTINDVAYRTPFIFIGNNFYDVDSLMERKALNKGLLSVYMIEATKRRVLLKLLLYALIGRAAEAAEFKSAQTTAITIEVNRPRIRVSLDGEHKRLTTPLHYIIDPGSIRALY